jgi:uncharacterized protein (TIGR02444 family)
MNIPAEGQPCWKFVAEFYARPGVSHACPQLQDRLGLDVSFLLAVLFYAVRRGLDLSAEEIKKLDRCISAWRNEVILPLRKLRRRLKSGDLLSPSTDEFYRRIKADELLTEQIEISALAQQFEQMSGNAAAAPSSFAVIERVARYFAEACRQEVTSSAMRFKSLSRFFIPRRPSDQLPVRTPHVSAESTRRSGVFCFAESRCRFYTQLRSQSAEINGPAV